MPVRGGLCKAEQEYRLGQRKRAVGLRRLRAAQGLRDSVLQLSRIQDRLQPAWEVVELVRACAVRDVVPADTTPHSLRHTFATRYLATHPDDL